MKRRRDNRPVIVLCHCGWKAEGLRGRAMWRLGRHRRNEHGADLVSMVVVLLKRQA